MWGPQLVESVIEAKSDFSTQIENTRINYLEGEIEFKDWTVDNPNDFPEDDFIRIDQIYLKGKPTRLIQGKQEFEEIIIDFSRLTYVRKKEGADNVRTFFSNLKTTSEEETNKAESEEKPYFVKKLVFKIDTLSVRDYAQSQAKIKDIPVGYERTFHDVDNLRDVGVIVGKDLSRYGAKELAGALLQSLFAESDSQALSERILQNAESILENVGGDAEEVGKSIKKIFDSLKEDS